MGWHPVQDVPCLVHLILWDRPQIPYYPILPLL